MFRTLHKVEIEFASVPYRACRPFQEKLSTDYGSNGKLLFEWDKMRERYYVHGLPAILNTCTPCPMNVFGGIEGCKGEVEGLTTFLKVLMHLKPDSSIFKHRFQNEYMVHDDTRTFIAEMHRVMDLMVNTEWPIAQVLVNGYAKEIDGPRAFVYYEWEGDEDETFIFSNDGYSVGIDKDGLVVKDASGARQPFLFSVLTRERTQVSGETAEGQLIGFEPVRDCLPAWDEEPDYVDSQLVFTRVQAADLFSDVLQVFTTCGEIALKHNTGLRIQLLS